MEKSDSHYRGIEGESSIEPIVIMEELLERLILNGVPPKEGGDIFLAQKHITRAGTKKDEDWRKEIQKSINYLTRAVTGAWVE